jgi:predicted nucleotidyltransferase
MFLTITTAHRTAPDYSGFIIYRCIVGSRAYGLDIEGSDIDRRGIYLPPAELHWSIYGVPGQLVSDEELERRTGI